jgi:beta-lactamase regulating signal transducer with metallopeptidase domain
MSIFDSIPSAVFAELLNSAARATILAAAAGIGLAALRVKNTSVRLLVWTWVLYGALAIPFVGKLVPPLSIATPAVLAQKNASEHQMQRTEPLPVSMAATRIREIRRARADATAGSNIAGTSSSVGQVPLKSPRSVSFGTAMPWSVMGIGLYLAVALVFLARFVAGLVFTSRLIRGAKRIDEPRVCAVAPQVAESALVSVPVTVGAIHPRILLPTTWREWDDATVNAVLAHEVSHVQRRDTLTQQLSLLHRAIFWFSPFAWWLDRHLASLAEQASDEAALSHGADRNAYARVLLGFFEVLQTGAERVQWQGVSMAKAGQAELRLEKILSWKGSVPMSLRRSITIAIIALAVPVVYLAAAVRPAGASGAQVAPVAPPAPRAPYGGVVAPAAPGAPTLAPIGRVPAIAGAPGSVPTAPSAPVVAGIPPVPALAPQARADGYSYGYGYDDEERFVIVSGSSDSHTMSGSMQDLRHVEKIKKQISGDFIWFQRDEKSYIIRDQATINRARAFWAPQEELGKKQEELGKQQEELGRQQEALGKKMEEVRVNVPDMTGELDKLKAKLQKLGSSATVEQLGDLQSEIGELQSKLGEIQSKAGDQQGKVGELQGELGEKQGKLGELQGELGRQQGELAEKAQKQMKALLDEAVKNGTAKPEEELVKNGGSL